ncbi:MAG: nucleotide exchange factor GrpE [Phycisphaerae bacterium]
MSRHRHGKPRRPDEADHRAAPEEPGRAARDDAAAGGEAAPDAPSPGAEAADEPAAPETLETPLEESRREVQDLKDRLQRLAADFSNYQKRMQRRLEEEKREAVRAFLRDLLPVIDNFERALAAADEGGDPAAFHQGVCLVHDQLLEALARHGVEPIDAAGRRFDPEHHEAVAHVPSEEHPSGHVIDEVQRGYRHGDRTLRPSQVAVSRGPAEGEGGEDEDARAEGAESDGPDEQSTPREGG